VFDVDKVFIGNIAGMLSERRPPTEVGGDDDTNDDSKTMSCRLLTCLNDDNCKAVNVDEVQVEEIASMLMERPPTLRQVRGGYVMPMMSTALYPSYSFEVGGGGIGGGTVRPAIATTGGGVSYSGYLASPAGVYCLDLAEG